VEEEEGEGMFRVWVWGGEGERGEKEGYREREESVWVRAREREEGSKRMEVCGWGEEEREEGCGSGTLEPWTTTITNRDYSIFTHSFSLVVFGLICLV